jgi:hypothetical protein
MTTGNTDEKFLSAIRSLDSPSFEIVACEHCSRVHFYQNPEAKTLNFVERRLLESKSFPNYVSHDSGIAFGVLDNKHYVFGCPCNAARGYQNFIERNSDLIRKYFSSGAEEERADLRKAQYLASMGSQNPWDLIPSLSIIVDGCIKEEPADMREIMKMLNG